MSDAAATVRHKRRWPIILGLFTIVLVGLIAAFQWDWLIPIVTPRVSAAIGRAVALGHLHVRLGQVTQVVLDDLTIGNPPGWPGGGNFATAEHVIVDIDMRRLFHDRQIVLSRLEIDRPNVEMQELADKSANWAFGNGSSGPSQPSDTSPTKPKLEQLVITDGSIHVQSTPLKADFDVTVSTQKGQEGGDEVIAHAKGTYAKQPITAEFTGGGLLSLEDQSTNYPVQLRLQNGPTTADAKGTIEHPLAFAGLNATLELSGPDMSLLLPLTGIAIPKTPPYRVSGHVAYADRLVTVTDFAGKVGSSDIAGTLKINAANARPDLTADLHSRSVNLDDLSGFIGSEPSNSPDKPRNERRDGRVLPNEPLSIPRLNAADVHLIYSAGRIQGRRQPLDDMKVALDIVDGNVSLHPLTFGIGRGNISSQIELAQHDDGLAAKAAVDFRQVDLGKLLNATGVAEGTGSIGGHADIDGTGKSIAQILARGNGQLRLYMGAGGNLSALLVDLSGLQFGNALLSALGLPTRTKIDCFLTDFVLKNGNAESRLTLLDTDEARVGISGHVDLRTEGLNLLLRTEPKHFTIGSLPIPIEIDGTLGSPQISPVVSQAGARVAAATGLGVLLGPLAAVLPTVQTGIGEDNACSGLLREIRSPASIVPARQTPERPAPATRRHRR